MWAKEFAGRYDIVTGVAKNPIDTGNTLFFKSLDKYFIEVGKRQFFERTYINGSKNPLITNI